MKRIIFSDVDGTLLNSEHRITPKTLEALKKLEKENIPFVIVSARGPSGIYPFFQEYGLSCPIIAYSGALILDEERKELFHRGMDRKKVKAILDFIEERRLDLTWCLYSFDQWIVKEKDDPRVLREERIVKAEAIQGTADSIKEEEIHKILCICGPGKIDRIEQELKQEFPDCSIVRSSEILLEIMAGGISKADAVRTLCARWNTPVENAIAFGDHYNDADMLQTVGMGFLMGNAPDPLKEKIKLHTLDNDHDGICHALMEQGILRRDSEKSVSEKI